MIIYLIVLAVVVVAALLAFGLAALLHLHGTAAIVFITVILLLGLVTAAVILILHYRAKKKQAQEGDPAGAGASSELDVLLNDANRKLRDSQQGAKTLDSLPLIYILGDAGTAKTTTVLRSGLDPELVAGVAPRENDTVPTPVINLWFTKLAALLEAGAAVRQSHSMLSRMVERTRPKAYRSAFGPGAAPRAAIVCVSAEQIMTADGGTALMASARSVGDQLREIARLLGTTLPVYVIVTKLDRVPHFEEYVRNLSNDEVRQILGSPLAKTDVSAGVYADQASRTLAAVLDGLTYQLGEFRVEMLDRENDARNAPGVYEFPREFGKLRKNLNQYLVELCKPSHLSANPYLRGFYFTGIRAQMIEQLANVPSPEAQRPAADAGATQYLSLSMGQAGMAKPAAKPVMTTARVAQWTFLPRLLPEIILGDRSALSATAQTAPARLFRRILYGCIGLLLFVYIVLLVVSFLNNSALESKVDKAAKALTTTSASASSVPSLTDLQNLDQIRQTIVQLDGYEKDGAPWSYRFGLYQGDALNAHARQVYFSRFRPLMLNPAQSAFVAFMRPLPEAPATNSDFSLYTAAYQPLKAYLITTTHPEKSDPTFLDPVFLQYWIGQRQVDPDQQQLAQKQIDFYANELLRKPPYSINPDTQVVAHTQVYLNNFRGENRIYSAMLNDADKAGETINFNKRYPNPCVSDGYVVRGAFSKNGFTFMQAAMLNPAKYAGGEAWVLGSQAGQTLDLASVTSDLKGQYPRDYMAEWHKFLTSAQVGNCGGLHEAAGRINILAGPNSPLLALFFTVGHNTAVADTQIKSAFQPTQAVVDPNAVDRYIGPGNTAYTGALLNLATAVDQVAAAPPSSDAAAFQPIIAQASTAKSAVGQTAQGFSIDDPQFKTGATVQNLMLVPIDCAMRLVPSPGAAANGAGANICKAVNSLMGKFPFAPKSTVMASLTDVNQVYAPDTGVVWTTFGGALKGYLVPQMALYVPAPNPPQPVNPKFAQYFSRVARISSGFYPVGAKSPTLSFNLKFVTTPGVSSATFVVDGQRIPTGVASQAFHWDGATAQKASLIYDGTETPLDFSGTWAVFQLVRTAQITKTAGGYRLDYPINTSTSIAGHTISQAGGSTKTVSFELSGPGAELLVGDDFAGLVCSPVVK